MCSSDSSLHHSDHAPFVWKLTRLKPMSNARVLAGCLLHGVSPRGGSRCGLRCASEVVDACGVSVCVSVLGCTWVAMHVHPIFKTEMKMIYDRKANHDPW